MLLIFQFFSGFEMRKFFVIEISVYRVFVDNVKEIHAYITYNYLPIYIVILSLIILPILYLAEWYVLRKFRKVFDELCKSINTEEFRNISINISSDFILGLFFALMYVLLLFLSVFIVTYFYNLLLVIFLICYLVVMVVTLIIGLARAYRYDLLSKHGISKDLFDTSYTSHYRMNIEFEKEKGDVIELVRKLITLL